MLTWSGHDLPGIIMRHYTKLWLLSRFPQIKLYIKFSCQAGGYYSNLIRRFFWFRTPFSFVRFCGWTTNQDRKTQSVLLTPDVDLPANLAAITLTANYCGVSNSMI